MRSVLCLLALSLSTLWLHTLHLHTPCVPLLQVTTHEALLRFLCAKAPGRIGVATLPFEGKNKVVYLLPQSQIEERRVAGLGVVVSSTEVCPPCDIEAR